MAVSADVHNDIVTAIQARRVLEFSYHGKYRVAKPHIYGIFNGLHQLLTFQTAGDSASGDLPNWRRLNVDELSDLRITDEVFPGTRPQASGKQSKFDAIIAAVA